MSSPAEEAGNPYRAPTTRMSDDPDSGGPHGDVLRRFRRNIHLLGGLWIFFGVLASVGTLLFFRMNAPPGVDRAEFASMKLLLAVGALVYLAFGLAACRKQLWAVYIGTGLIGLSAVGSLMQMRLCSVLVALTLVYLGVRTIQLAHQLRAAGVPLDARP